MTAAPEAGLRGSIDTATDRTNNGQDGAVLNDVNEKDNIQNNNNAANSSSSSGGDQDPLPVKAHKEGGYGW